MRMLPVIAAVVLSVVTISAQPVALRSTAPLNLKLNSVTVGEAFNAIERASGITIRIAESVPAATLSRSGVMLTFRDAAVMNAIDVVAGFSNLSAVVADETTVVIQARVQ